MISDLSIEGTKSQLLWNTRLPEKEKESSDLEIASHHSVSAQKAVLNLSRSSELSTMNVERLDIFESQGWMQGNRCSKCSSVSKALF